jgi:hypothetical protein
MKDRIIAVTPPDDTLQDGNRLLLVDLNEQQMQIMSQALLKLEDFSTIITYIWKVGDDIDWLLDKKLKSDLVVFNAESIDQTVVGYMAAQPESYYYGILKGLNKSNPDAIYDIEQTVEILEKTLI